MIDVFSYDNYHLLLSEIIKASPRNGHGVAAQLARRITVHPSLITQVLKEERDLTVEQALDVALFFELSPLQTEYWVQLVQFNRAGTSTLRSFCKKQLELIRIRSKQLKEHIPYKETITEEAKYIFYSQWFYSAIRILTSIENFQTVEALTKKLSLPRDTVEQTLDFLCSQGLCKKVDNRFVMGVQNTHLAEPILVSRHHINWRNKAIEKVVGASEDELFFTGPVSISKADAEVIRTIVLASIQNIMNVVKPSACEEAYCLNIDFFRF